MFKQSKTELRTGGLQEALWARSDSVHSERPTFDFHAAYLLHSSGLSVEKQGWALITGSSPEAG